MMKKRFLCTVLFCTALLSGCGTSSSVKPAEATEPAETTVSADEQNAEAVQMEPTIAAVTASQKPTEPSLISVSVLPHNHQILVDPLLQMPELPAGCEITSLTCLLNHLGYNVDKEVMVDTYLDYEVTSGTNYTFFEKYIGDPRSNGYGCYAPVLMRAATEFLNDQNSPLEAVNLSGSTKEEILLVIASDHPVVIWGTTDNMDVYESLEWTTPDGTDVYWCIYEHCMLLTGYDMAENTVTVCDPLKGKVEYNMTQFFEVYDDMYQQAITIY